MKWAVPKLRLYLDTTIPNYVFAIDAFDRMQITQRFMKLVRDPHYEMIISDVVMRELLATPEPKRSMLVEQVSMLAVLPLTSEANALAQNYVQARILPKSSIEDARHVAIATLNRVDALVSWNFGHLVNIRRSRAISLLHRQRGLPHLEIITPEEVVNL